MTELTPQMRSLALPIYQQLQQGISFAESLRAGHIDSLLIEQVTIAANHGDLVTCLAQIANFLQMRLHYRQRLQQLLLYPVILLLFLFLLIIGLRCSVITELQDVTQQGIMPVDILFIGLSITLIITVITSISYWHYLRHRSALQRAQTLCHLPLIGKLWRNYYHYMLVFDLAILVQNGLTFAQICSVLSQQRYHSVLSEMILAGKQCLDHGDNVNAFIKQTALLPLELLLFINQGCSYQELGIALHFLADVQFKKLQQALNRTIIWLQPLLFLLIAMMIIAVYMSVLLPVYQMMEGF